MIDRAIPIAVVVLLLGVLCFGSDQIGSAHSPAAVYDVELVQVESIGQMETLERRIVAVEVTNQGSLVWAPDSGVRLAYHWLDLDGKVVVLDGKRTSLIRDVSPGEEIRLDAIVVAPARPGEYLLQWDLVHERVCWFAQRDPTPLLPVPVTVTQAPATHAFQLLSHETPKLMWADGVAEVDLHLRNEGLEPWEANASFKMSYHWKTLDGEDAGFEGERTRFDQTIAPGQDYEVTARLRAPVKNGRYILHWDPVEEFVCWFSDGDPTPVDPIQVWVLPQPLKTPAVALLTACVLVGAAVVVLRWRSAPLWLVEIVAVADVVWLFSALSCKQWGVLAEVGRRPTQDSGWMVIAGAAVLILAVLILPRRIRPFACWFIGGVTSFVVFSDTINLRFFGNVFSMAAFGGAGQTDDVWETVASLTLRKDIWLAIDLLMGCVLVALVVPLQRRGGTTARWVAVALAAILVVPGTNLLWRMTQTRSHAFSQVYDNIVLVREIGLLNFHAYDGYRAARNSFLRPPLGQDEYEQILSWFDNRRDLRKGQGPSFGVASGMNLVMIQVESMQGFAVGLEIDGQEVTPNMNRWRDGALWFPRCTDQTYQGRTSDAELMTQASVLPAPAGAASFRFAGNRFLGLAEVLAENGYATMSAIPFPSGFWNRRILHGEYGYERSLFKDEFTPGLNVGWGLNDRDFLAQMLPHLEKLPQPFCALMITLSNHHPYSGFPEDLVELKLGQLEGSSLGNYVHTMHFFDKAIGLFVDGLAENGLLENTVVAIWGDHGSGLGWDQEMVDLIGQPRNGINYYLADRVPLMIYVPQQTTLRGEQRIRCGLTDVAPTLLALFGVDPSPLPYMGRNLLGTSETVPVTRRQGAWVSDGLVYIGGETGDIESGACYDDASLERVPVDRCRALDIAARENLEVGRLVLNYDLQQRLRADLKSPRLQR
ncbi:MAG: sulfatase-like hydrolase/transferase [bacterium]|nr:sulfatase-like hydrolase/transferase [bacterium]